MHCCLRHKWNEGRKEAARVCRRCMLALKPCPPLHPSQPGPAAGYRGQVVQETPICVSDPGMSNANMRYVTLEVLAGREEQRGCGLGRAPGRHSLEAGHAGSGG